MDCELYLDRLFLTNMMVKYEESKSRCTMEKKQAGDNILPILTIRSLSLERELSVWHSHVRVNIEVLRQSLKKRERFFICLLTTLFVHIHSFRPLVSNKCLNMNNIQWFSNLDFWILSSDLFILPASMCFSYYEYFLISLPCLQN